MSPAVVVRYFDGRLRMEFDRDTFEIASDMLASGWAMGETIDYLSTSGDVGERNHLRTLVVKAKNEPIRDEERS